LKLQKNPLGVIPLDFTGTAKAPRAGLQSATTRAGKGKLLDGSSTAVEEGVREDREPRGVGKIEESANFDMPGKERVEEDRGMAGLQHKGKDPPCPVTNEHVSSWFPERKRGAARGGRRLS